MVDSRYVNVVFCHTAKAHCSLPAVDTPLSRPTIGSVMS